MTKLSVNVNKVATIRNARGGSLPDPVDFAMRAENFGADGITVHPRPDERHITKADVRALKKVVKTEFNIEGYPDRRFMDLIEEVRPEQVTLVPDSPEVITSNAGWNCIEHQSLLSEIVVQLRTWGCRVSLFLDPDPSQVAYAAKTGADRIELYTEAYASLYTKGKEEAIADYISTAKTAVDHSLGINAGHDLSLENLAYFAQRIPQLQEVSIGHALISDALYYGLNNTVQMYKRALIAETTSS